MGKTLPLLLAICLPFGMCGCAKSEPAPTPGAAPGVLRPDDHARTVIEKSIKAYGGEAKLARWRCGQIQYEAAGPFLPFPNATASVEETFQLPADFKRSATYRFQGKEITHRFAVKDGKGWERRPDGVVRPFALKDYVAHPRHQFAAFFDVAAIKAEGRNLSAAGEEKVGQSPATVLRWEKDGNLFDLYFDRTTGLLLKTARRPVSHGPGTQALPTTDTLLADYREIDGGMVPMKITGYQDGRLFLNISFRKVEFFDRLDESLFGNP